MKKKIEFVADFETSCDKKYIQMERYRNGKKEAFQMLDRINSRAWVCCWCVCNTEDKHIIRGRSIQEFMEWAKGQAGNTIFFHNLSFDGRFIMDYVFKSENMKIDKEVNSDSIYSFEVVWKDGKRVTFRDSLKIFPMKAEKLGKLYGIQKLMGDWDYKKVRYPDTPISEEEWKYVEHDVLIVATALKDYRNRGFLGNTQASIAYEQRFKMTFGEDKWNNKKRGYFPKEIPPLDNYLQDRLSMAYFGGITYLNPLWANKPIKDVVSFDVNSMYPDKMRNAMLPWGPPKRIPTHSKIAGDCVIYVISGLSATLKSERHLPFLMFPTYNQGYIRCQGKVIKCVNELVYLTNDDLEILENEYYIDNMHIMYAYYFNARKGMYADFVDYWMKEKADATVLLNEGKKKGLPEDELLVYQQRRQIAKVMLNSSYGKDGTKTDRIVHKTAMVEGVLTSEKTISHESSQFYLPAAIFICSKARKQLYEAAKTVGDEFIYCDTDSIKTTLKGAELMKKSAFIDDTALGAWKDEGHYDEAIFVRQKTYACCHDGKWEYTICGATEDMKKVIDIHKFKPGMIITLEEIRENNGEGKLRPITVNGGVVFEEMGFEINIVDNWDELSGKNMPIEDFEKVMEELNND